MSSTIFFFIFVPFLAFVLLSINLIFAPHNPYQEKESAFECGFHSFLGQNRTQFSISFFIFALLFLLFDLEILLVYPYIVSAYTNSVYGLFIMLMFFIALTIGLGFELGKKALNIDSRQISSLDINSRKNKKQYILSHPSAAPFIQSKISILKISFLFFIFWLLNNPIRFNLIMFVVRTFLLSITNIDFGVLYMADNVGADGDLHVAVSPPPSPNNGGGGSDSPADASPAGSSDSESASSPDGSDNEVGGTVSPVGSGDSEDVPNVRVGYWGTEHSHHGSTPGTSCLDNPNHDSEDFPVEERVMSVYYEPLPPLRGEPTELDHFNRYPKTNHADCCRCGQDTYQTEGYECNQCGCTYCPGCVTEGEKTQFDSRHND